MYFSALQKHILLHCLGQRGRCSRKPLVGFYKKKKVNKVRIITKSIERLIDKEMLVGYGVRTSHKWFIREVKLTSRGRRRTKKLLGEQQKLPLKNNKE